MLQRIAQVFGAVLLLVGILGFVPGITTEEGLLLGIFHVDALHNLIHIVTGVAALAASTSATASRTFFQIFGVVYALIALAGFIPGLVDNQSELFGLVSINMPDNLLHVALAALALYMGFGYKNNRDVVDGERGAAV